MSVDGGLLGLGELLGLWEAEGETDALGLEDGETLALGLEDGLTEAEGDWEAEGELLGETLALGLTLADGDCDGEPVLDSSKARNSPAVSPETASVGLLVSPVLVLIRNSPQTPTAEALLRDRVLVIWAVKLVESVSAVVLFASLPRPRK